MSYDKEASTKRIQRYYKKNSEKEHQNLPIHDKKTSCHKGNGNCD